ncbi:mobile mystery protein B [Thalassospira sp.]|uniref:mobile mystery protein B n=1 Tax=Thalassospira sp. TaxID=1912094 RepID=UPI002735A36C|nr:mobile mystery protein B [Thalassospira sp.]MDP2697485.1 mobile mystery protein B [Thalassospira sp.]
MTDPLYGEDDDANTPLTDEERGQLIPTYITLRRELNEAELVNILAATRWVSGRKRDILDDGFLRQLHKRMFNQVWRWAGIYRTTARNIGMDAWRIAVEVRQLVDDVRFQIDHQTFEPDEIAVRFAHRLVSIHPFPNGNGRHSRLAGDLLAVQLGQPPFSWGRINLVDPGETRKAYINALQCADRHDIQPLLGFARL